MKKFTIRYPCDIEPERYWREVFFDREYTETLWREAYNTFAYDLVEETIMPDGRRTRTARVTPKLDVPLALRKLIGDSMAFVERGRFEIEGPNAPKWVARLLPARPADILISIETRLERTGPGQSDRIAEVELACPNYQIVEFLESTLRKGLQRASEVTERWLQKHRDSPRSESLDAQTGLLSAFPGPQQMHRWRRGP
ncbi:hypothetical protein [Nannocystis radixulma]|uniref:Polyketide cyclase / dehydrase and lipid transport n=1 Tax=Nannocystis radixulma TaxID=2995305 RepID=A0ABT5B6L1_9BACT|nr:hypothetical protein [Nannocystis radixulma]MDC0669744.1 hypothetical protein [Nannocystis radixulma]